MAKVTFGVLLVTLFISSMAVAQIQEKAAHGSTKYLKAGPPY